MFHNVSLLCYPSEQQSARPSYRPSDMPYGGATDSRWSLVYDVTSSSPQTSYLTTIQNTLLWALCNIYLEFVLNFVLVSGCVLVLPIWPLFAIICAVVLLSFCIELRNVVHNYSSIHLARFCSTMQNDGMLVKAVSILCWMKSVGLSSVTTFAWPRKARLKDEKAYLLNSSRCKYGKYGFIMYLTKV